MDNVGDVVVLKSESRLFVISGHYRLDLDHQNFENIDQKDPEDDDFTGILVDMTLDDLRNFGHSPENGDVDGFVAFVDDFFHFGYERMED